VGALPHLDPETACNDVLRIFPEFPYIPTLPNRGVCESIVFNDSAHLPGRVIAGDRITVDSSQDLSERMEQIYLDYLEANYAPYAATLRTASGFFEMIERPLTGLRYLKCQVTGPVTFGMQVVDQDRRPIFYDSRFADVLPKLIALRARWCEKTMHEKTGVGETLVVLNEPYFASIGSSVVPVDRPSVEAGWQDIVSITEGSVGIHCCSNTDWGFVMSLDPAVISFDAYANAREFLLYKDDLASFIERGGVVAWGIVPADHQIFLQESIDSLFDRYSSIREQVTAYIAEDLFDDHALITPNCGIRFADEQGASDIMDAAAELSRRVRSIRR
jgi:hypothetical protein